MLRRLLSCAAVSLLTAAGFAQSDTLHLTVLDEAGEPVYGATAMLLPGGQGAATNFEGRLSLVLPKGYPARVQLSSVGLATVDTVFRTAPTVPLSLKPAATALIDVVVSGTLTPTLRTESPIPVEVYTRTFLLANPTPSLFEAMANVNGVRPQLNCSVCNTGDIHINGLEGPYTMVTIDGMPIVSGLGTVYGLTGIPNAMIERIEVVKGPAGSIYGSESIGGLINVITRDVDRAPRFAFDAFSTAWGDVTLDAGVTHRVGQHARVLSSANGYFFDNRIDNNGDGFTDQTLAQRISLFQKWHFGSGTARGLDLAGRFLAESRWGGEVDFDPKTDRGGDVRYGESIDTRRAELLTRYDFPTVDGLAFVGSANYHRQRSDYGTTRYDADQGIAFGQVTLSRKLGRHGLLFGAATRYTFYDDDTPATAEADGPNRPDQILLPGAFVQDEYTMGRHRILAGMRYDYDRRHGSIWTPRVAYKMPLGEGANLRFNLGSGFRVVNLFTEDHAALTGSRNVVIANELKPERSVSLLINFDKRIVAGNGVTYSLDASTWYTRFSNQILPDYLSNVQEIRYDNLSDHSRSRGASAELKARNDVFGATAGVTYTDVAIVEGAETRRPLLSERWSGVASADYTLPNARGKHGKFLVNYTSSFYGPMLLPIQGPNDPRPAESPWWSLQNIQLTWSPRGSNWELYGGVKNLLDFTPAANSIARSFDPFDRDVSFDASGLPRATPNNPNALVFDPSYVYASNAGRRAFLGARWILK